MPLTDLALLVLSWLWSVIGSKEFWEVFIVCFILKRVLFPSSIPFCEPWYPGCPPQRMEWIERYPFESKEQAIARVTTQHLVARLVQENTRHLENIEALHEQIRANCNQC